MSSTVTPLPPTVNAHHRRPSNGSAAAFRRSGSVAAVAGRCTVRRRRAAVTAYRSDRRRARRRHGESRVGERPTGGTARRGNVRSAGSRRGAGHSRSAATAPRRPARAVQPQRGTTGVHPDRAATAPPIGGGGPRCTPAPRTGACDELARQPPARIQAGDRDRHRGQARRRPGSPLTVLLAEGHLLIEDVPGVGKTMLAKALARSIDCSVRRIQFTPDLLPSDVTGVSVYNQETRDFEFKPGAVFANIVVGDEINRASPKTQSALLECMEERQVTVDGTTYLLEPPFMVIATQNPVEMEGTYPLPEAQRDRFMARVSMGYPRGRRDRDARQPRRRRPARRARAGRRRRDVREADRHRPRRLRLAGGQAVRRQPRRPRPAPPPDLRLGASPRAALHLLRAAQGAGGAGRPRLRAARRRPGSWPRRPRPPAAAHGRGPARAPRRDADRRRPADPSSPARRHRHPRPELGQGSPCAGPCPASPGAAACSSPPAPSPRRRHRGSASATCCGWPSCCRAAAGRLLVARGAGCAWPRRAPSSHPGRRCTRRRPCGWTCRTSPGSPPACCWPRTPCPTRWAPGRGSCSTSLAAGAPGGPLRPAVRVARPLPGRPAAVRLTDPFGLCELTPVVQRDRHADRHARGASGCRRCG